MKKKISNKTTIIFWSFIAIVIVFIIFLPYILTNFSTSIDFGVSKSNEIGDTIGGIMGPAVALLAAFLTFLAFRAQVDANAEIQKQFRLQQFENQIYKSVDIYRDNVSKWKKHDKKTNHDFTDRLVAVSVLETYDIIHKEVMEFHNKYWVGLGVGNFYTSEYYNELSKLYNGYNGVLLDKDSLENWMLSEFAYIVLFYGLEDNGRGIIIKKFENKLNSDFVVKFINLFSYKVTRKLDEDDRYAVYFFYDTRPSFITYNMIYGHDTKYLNALVKKPLIDRYDVFKYYNGIQTIFSHHYRHLFITFKYINSKDEIPYIERWKTYANLLRSQMTNTEQILFFLNSITMLGREWELNHITDRTKPDITKLNNRLVTKYDIIKNIPDGDRAKYNIELFYPDIEWEDKPMSDIEMDEHYTIRKKFKKLYESK